MLEYLETKLKITVLLAMEQKKQQNRILKLLVLVDDLDFVVYFFLFDFLYLFFVAEPFNKSKFVVLFSARGSMVLPVNK